MAYNDDTHTDALPPSRVRLRIGRGSGSCGCMLRLDSAKAAHYVSSLMLSPEWRSVPASATVGIGYFGGCLDGGQRRTCKDSD